jgi:hypothetical protein
MALNAGKSSVFVPCSALSEADTIEKKRGRVIAETVPFSTVVIPPGTWVEAVMKIVSSSSFQLLTPISAVWKLETIFGGGNHEGQESFFTEHRDGVVACGVRH